MMHRGTGEDVSMRLTVVPLVEQVVDWFLRDSPHLVMDVDDNPVQIHDLIERWYTESDVLARKRFALAVALAVGGTYPRDMCQCGEAACRGCGGYPCDVAVPLKVRAFAQEVKQ